MITQEYTFSFPSNHLVTISLLHDPDSRYEPYFAIIKLAPGDSDGSNNNRTYDTKNSINMKFSIRELPALAAALKAYCMGDKAFPPYSKFSKSRDTTKTLSVFAGKRNEKGGEEPTVVLKVATPNVKYGIRLSPYEAYSLGSIIEKIFEFAIQKDIEFQKSSPAVFKENDSPQPSKKKTQDNYDDFSDDDLF